jgi:hypothetical protein
MFGGFEYVSFLCSDSSDTKRRECGFWRGEIGRCGKPQGHFKCRQTEAAAETFPAWVVAVPTAYNWSILCSWVLLSVGVWMNDRLQSISDVRTLKLLGGRWKLNMYQLHHLVRVYLLQWDIQALCTMISNGKGEKPTPIWFERPRTRTSRNDSLLWAAYVRYACEWPRVTSHSSPCAIHETKTLRDFSRKSLLARLEFVRRGRAALTTCTMTNCDARSGLFHISASLSGDWSVCRLLECVPH